MRIGLLVSNNPINGIDPLGLMTYFTYYTGLDDGYRMDGIYTSAAVGAVAITVATAGSADYLAAALAARFPWLVPAAAAGAAAVNGINGQQGPTMCTVSRWGRPGLQPGDWVMKGPATPWNYFWSGKYQPSWMPGGNIPAPFAAGQQFSVPASSITTPPGVTGAVKGALGQGIYTGD